MEDRPISAELFPILGCLPSGAAFRRIRIGRGQGIVAIISYDVWQRRFASDRGALWKRLNFDGKMLSPDYLNVMGIPLLEGRFFNEHDREDSEPVIVIDENLARHAFGSKSVCQPTYLDFGYAWRAR